MYICIQFQIYISSDPVSFKIFVLRMIKQLSLLLCMIGNGLFKSFVHTLYCGNRTHIIVRNINLSLVSSYDLVPDYTYNSLVSMYMYIMVLTCK